MCLQIWGFAKLPILWIAPTDVDHFDVRLINDDLHNNKQRHKLRKNSLTEEEEETLVEEEEESKREQP